MTDAPSFTVAWHPTHSNILTMSLVGFWPVGMVYEFTDQVRLHLAQRPTGAYDILSEMVRRGLQSQDVIEAMMKTGEELKQNRPARRTAIVLGTAAASVLNQRQVNRTAEQVLLESAQFATEEEALAWLLQRR